MREEQRKYKTNKRAYYTRGVVNDRQRDNRKVETWTK